MTLEVNVLALVKGQERYVFLYTDQNRTEILRQIYSMGTDPTLSFSRFDAAVLSAKVRKEAAATQHRPFPLSTRFQLPPPREAELARWVSR